MTYKPKTDMIELESRNPTSLQRGKTDPWPRKLDCFDVSYGTKVRFFCLILF